MTLPIVLLLVTSLLSTSGPRDDSTVVLSNTELPRDNFGNPLVTGEADILTHPTDGHHYFYFNNWGNCSGVNCCNDTRAGCRSCCFRKVLGCAIHVDLDPSGRKLHTGTHRAGSPNYIHKRGPQRCGYTTRLRVQD